MISCVALLVFRHHFSPRKNLPKSSDKTKAWYVDMASIDAMSRPSSNTEGVVASPSPCGEDHCGRTQERNRYLKKMAKIHQAHHKLQ